MTLTPPEGMDWSNNFGYATLEEMVRDANLPEGSEITLSVTPEDVAAMSSPTDVLHAWKVATVVHGLVARVEGPDDFLAL